MRVICDLMGSDRGPGELLRGVCAAAPLTDAQLILVGDREVILRGRRKKPVWISAISGWYIPDRL